MGFIAATVGFVTYGASQVRRAYFMQLFAREADTKKQAEYAARAMLSSGEKDYARFWFSRLQFRGAAFMVAPLLYVVYRFTQFS